MSERLKKLMLDKMLSEGRSGKASLIVAADRGEKMIDRYVQGKSMPSVDIARRLALACGCGDEEASELALECSTEATKAG